MSCPETLTAGLKKRHRPITCVTALEGKGWTCEDLIIYTLEEISTHMHKECHLLVCLFALSPPEEKKRRQVKEPERCGRFCRAGKEGNVRETRRNRELLTEEEKGGGGDHMEEPSCDNCPTSMHRWECYECTLVSPATLPHFKQINPILYRLLQKPSNFTQRFIQRLLFFIFYFFCHTLPNYIYVT